jgi:hypothetical protein
VTTFAATRYSRGTTYVSTDHPTLVTYMGVAEAGGNVFNGVRWVSAMFKYSRGGSDVIGWQTSNATVSGCAWSRGPFVTRSIGDSLDPNAPVTKFHYDFRSMPTNVC